MRRRGRGNNRRVRQSSPDAGCGVNALSSLQICTNSINCRKYVGLIRRVKRRIRHRFDLLRFQRQRAVSEFQRLIQPNHQYQSYTRQCAPGNLIKYFNICIDGVVDRPGSIKRSLRCLIGNHARQIVRDRARKQHVNAG
ncbi:hypothetical protein EOL06_19215 [Escherichia coli]|nr:hypothetical protein EOL06_19215 [Escherichia coli]